MSHPNHQPWCHEIGSGGASIHTELVGMNLGRLGGNTFSIQWSPPNEPKQECRNQQIYKSARFHDGSLRQYRSHPQGHPGVMGRVAPAEDAFFLVHAG